MLSYFLSWVTGHKVHARQLIQKTGATSFNPSSLTAIRAALNQLAPLDREALVHQIRFSRSIAEISQHLRLPEAQVRIRLVRARTEIRLACEEDVRES